MFSWLEKIFIIQFSVLTMLYSLSLWACFYSRFLVTYPWSLQYLTCCSSFTSWVHYSSIFLHQLNLVGWFNAVFGIIFCIQTTCIIELGSCRRISSFEWFYAMLMWSGTHSNFYTIYFSLCFPVIYLEIYN